MAQPTQVAHEDKPPEAAPPAPAKTKVERRYGLAARMEQTISPTIQELDRYGTAANVAYKPEALAGAAYGVYADSLSHASMLCMEMAAYPAAPSGVYVFKGKYYALVKRYVQAPDWDIPIPAPGGTDFYPIFVCTTVAAIGSDFPQGVEDSSEGSLIQYKVYEQLDWLDAFRQAVSQAGTKWAFSLAHLSLAQLNDFNTTYRELQDATASFDVSSAFAAKVLTQFEDLVPVLNGPDPDLPPGGTARTAGDPVFPGADPLPQKVEIPWAFRTIPPDEPFSGDGKLDARAWAALKRLAARRGTPKTTLERALGRGKDGWHRTQFGKDTVVVGIDTSRRSGAKAANLASPQRLNEIRITAAIIQKILSKDQLSVKDYANIMDLLGQSGATLRLGMSSERGAALAYEHLSVVTRMFLHFRGSAISFENLDGDNQDCDLRLATSDGEEIYIDVYTGRDANISYIKTFKSEKECTRVVLWFRKEYKDRFSAALRGSESDSYQVAMWKYSYRWADLLSQAFAAGLGPELQSVLRAAVDTVADEAKLGAPKPAYPKKAIKTRHATSADLAIPDFWKSKLAQQWLDYMAAGGPKTLSARMPPIFKKADNETPELPSIPGLRYLPYLNAQGHQVGYFIRGDPPICAKPGDEITKTMPIDAVPSGLPFPEGGWTEDTSTKLDGEMQGFLESIPWTEFLRSLSDYAQATSLAMRYANIGWRVPPGYQGTPLSNINWFVARVPRVKAWVFVKRNATGMPDNEWFLVGEPEDGVPGAYCEWAPIGNYHFTRCVPMTGEDFIWEIAMVGAARAIAGHYEGRGVTKDVAQLNAMYMVISARENTQNFTFLAQSAKYIVAGMTGTTEAPPSGVAAKVLLHRPTTIGGANAYLAFLKLLAQADALQAEGATLPAGDGATNIASDLHIPGVFAVQNRDAAQEAYGSSALFCKDRIHNSIGQFRVSASLAEIASGHLVRDDVIFVPGEYPERVPDERDEDKDDHAEHLKTASLRAIEVCKGYAIAWEQSCRGKERKYLGNPYFAGLLGAWYATKVHLDEFDNVRAAFTGATKLFGPNASWDNHRQVKTGATAAVLYHVTRMDNYSEANPNVACTAMGVALHSAIQILARSNQSGQSYSFAKQQIGGPRDITVMEAGLKAVTYMIEALVEPATKVQEGQYLSDSNKEGNMQQRVVSEVRRLRTAYRKDVWGYVSDASAWGHTMDATCMSMATALVTTNDLGRTVLPFLLSAFQEKDVSYPWQTASMLEQQREHQSWTWRSGGNEVTFPQGILGACLQSEQDGTGGTDGVHLQTGMMMGLTNKTSSYYHVLALEYVRDRLGLDGTFLCTSDDGLELFHATPQQLDSYAWLRLAVHNLLGIITNEKKSYLAYLGPGSDAMVEINSLYYEARAEEFRPTPIRFYYGAADWPGGYSPVDWTVKAFDAIDRAYMSGAPKEACDGLYEGFKEIWSISPYRDLALPEYVLGGSCVCKNSWYAAYHFFGADGVSALLQSAYGWAAESRTEVRDNTGTAEKDGNFFSITRVGGKGRRARDAERVLEAIGTGAGMPVTASNVWGLWFSGRGRLARIIDTVLWDTSVLGRLKDWGAFGVRFFKGPAIEGTASLAEIARMYADGTILEAAKAHQKKNLLAGMPAYQAAFQANLAQILASIQRRADRGEVWVKSPAPTTGLAEPARYITVWEDDPSVGKYHAADMVYAACGDMAVARLLDPAYTPTVLSVAPAAPQEPDWRKLAGLAQISLGSVAPTAPVLLLNASSPTPGVALRQHDLAIGGGIAPKARLPARGPVWPASVYPESTLRFEEPRSITGWVRFAGDLQYPVLLRAAPLEPARGAMLRTWSFAQRAGLARAALMEVPYYKVARRALYPTASGARTSWLWPEDGGVAEVDITRWKITYHPPAGGEAVTLPHESRPGSYRWTDLYSEPKVTVSAAGVFHEIPVYTGKDAELVGAIKMPLILYRTGVDFANLPAAGGTWLVDRDSMSRNVREGFCIPWNRMAKPTSLYHVRAADRFEHATIRECFEKALEHRFAVIRYGSPVRTLFVVWYDGPVSSGLGDTIVAETGEYAPAN